MARTFVRSTGGRLLVLAVSAALLIGAGVALAGRASSAPKLPPVTAQELVASAIRATRVQPAISGRVGTHIDLGLPQLPNIGPDELTGPASVLQYVSGDHDLRVWSSSRGLRVADLLPAAERSITVTPANLWAWDSASFTAYHLAFPTPQSGAAGIRPRAGSPQAVQGLAGMLSPTTLAERALAGLSPTTSVTVATNAWVAGRPTYTLVLQPRTDTTLIGRIEMGIDSATRLPISIAVFARGAASPAVSATFTSVSFAPIDPSTFRFVPPNGARVVELPAQGHPMLPFAAALPMAGGPETAAPSSRMASESAGMHRDLGEYVRVFGFGWATVTAYRVPPLAELQNASGFDIGALLPFNGTLFSARLVDRGDHSWLLVGAVPQSSLERVAPRLP
jgi:hypothetical protein